ncbi:MAG: M48 family metallopeptidase, partial [Myxococcota bacterium]
MSVSRAGLPLSRKVDRSLTSYGARRGALLGTSFLLLLVAGCSGFRSVAAEVVLPPEDEVELGRQLSREVEAEVELHPDPLVQEYVSNLGSQILAAIDDPRPEAEWNFKVIDDPENVNAMALPGGWNYIFSGLMRVVESEAELGGVIAHEIAHVTQRHIAERLATIYGVEVLASVALGQDPSTLQRIVASIVAQGYLLNYSRGQEREADAFGVDYMIASGLDPRALAYFFEHLAGLPRPPVWISSHPNPEARIESIYELIEG